MSDAPANQSVPVNVYETSDAVVVLAPLPGVQAEDITVSLEENRLRIAAAMRTPAEKDYVVHEWHYGPYEREVEVPGEVGAGLEASFGNGQLAVRVLKGAGQGRITLDPASIRS